MIFWYVAGTAMLPSVPKIVSLLAKVISGRLFLKSFSANSLVSLIIFLLSATFVSPVSVVFPVFSVHFPVCSQDHLLCSL